MEVRIEKGFLLLLCSAALLAVGIGCGESVVQEDPRPAHERNAKPQPLNEEVFVDLERFKELREGGATIIDARPADLYDKGHLEGAVHSPGGGQFKDDNGMLWTDVVKLQNLVRDLGVDRERPVVIYGKAVSKKAGRLFWTLEYLGHGDVYLYPPGHETLLEKLGEEAVTEGTDVERGDFVVARRESVRATAEEVRQVVDGEREGILIDTRREGEYHGTEDRDDPRQGYIPEAIHYKWDRIFDADGNLRTKDELRSEFEQLSLVKDGVILVPYCQTGTRSAYVYAVLRWFGNESAANYDGSWVEWSRQEELPVAQTDGK